MRVATAGSCFAQHVGRALRNSGLLVIDAEPAPRDIPITLAQDYGYSTYSARYGNIYTSVQLQQILKEALGLFEPAEPVWHFKERFVDSQRPSVEPLGLDSPQQVLWHRERHLACILEMMKSCDLFVFTFGLTEAWLHQATGTVFSQAPGTLGGHYEPETYMFKNFRVHEVVESFRGFVHMARTLNPAMKFLITVSPIPLAATASGNHVEVATARSKAVLRAACDELTSEVEGVDYFPSYEIITSQWARGRFFGTNIRDVTNEGVQTVINILLQSYGLSGDSKASNSDLESLVQDDENEFDLRCEEVLLNRFSEMDEG